MSDTVFIGVDGGGTECRVVIGTRSTILGTGRSGPANVSSDTASAIKNIHVAMEQAMAGIDGVDLAKARAHMGLAGVLNRTQAKTVAAQMQIGQVVVTDDRPTTLTGVLGDHDGIVAAIGTGSFIGSKHDEAYQFVGGWGLMLSDEASGAWLGRTVLAETLLAQDGMRAHTDLTREIFALHKNDPNEIVAFATTATPGDIGSFAKCVVDAAGVGDVLAVDLLQRGADYIELALAVLKHHPDDIISLTGGLGPTYATFFPPAIKNRLRPAQGSALDGALTLARRMD